MLTGKTKKAFEEYIHNDETISDLEKIRISLCVDYGDLRAIYAYVVDFFDSHNIRIQSGLIIANGKFYHYNGKTRSESRTKAIEKADQIHNSQP